LLKNHDRMVESEVECHSLTCRDIDGLLLLYEADAPAY